jgi:hypothetical protein
VLAAQAECGAIRVAAPWKWCQHTQHCGARAFPTIIASMAPAVRAGSQRVRISQWLPSAAATGASTWASMSA